MGKLKLLVVDDEVAIGKTLARQFNSDYQVLLATSGEEGLALLTDHEVAMIISDQRMPGLSGVDFLTRSRQMRPAAMRLLITAYAEQQVTAEAINVAGIYAFIAKPWEPDQLAVVVHRGMERYQLEAANRRLQRELELANRELQKENRQLRQAVEKSVDFSNIITADAAMHMLFKQVRKVLDIDATVLLQGETGTGKELIARAIHFNGKRRKGPFVSQNCAALPDTLLESELFGHRKGAFTGAYEDKKGLLQQADGGTVFLDEIGDTSPDFQVKLLRFLQEGEFRPLGDVHNRRTDVRLIAATNRDLPNEVEQNKFRRDLFYRLSVVPLYLPPLRQRKDDIKLLALYFLRRYAREYKRSVVAIDEQSLASLQAYSFPGNVRELENIIARAVVLHEGDEILRISDFHLPQTDDAQAAPVAGENLPAAVAELERRMVLQALAANNDNYTLVAKKLGISRQGLYKKLKRLNIS
jgi:two-component system response regulator HupR/HoxA